MIIKKADFLNPSLVNSSLTSSGIPAILSRQITHDEKSPHCICCCVSLRLFLTQKRKTVGQRRKKLPAVVQEEAQLRFCLTTVSLLGSKKCFNSRHLAAKSGFSPTKDRGHRSTPSPRTSTLPSRPTSWRFRNWSRVSATKRAIGWVSWLTKGPSPVYPTPGNSSLASSVHLCHSPGKSCVIDVPMWYY